MNPNGCIKSTLSRVLMLGISAVGCLSFLDARAQLAPLGAQAMVGAGGNLPAVENTVGTISQTYNGTEGLVAQASASVFGVSMPYVSVTGYGAKGGGDLLVARLSYDFEVITSTNSTKPITLDMYAAVPELATIAAGNSGDAAGADGLASISVGGLGVGYEEQAYTCTSFHSTSCGGNTPTSQKIIYNDISYFTPLTITPGQLYSVTLIDSLQVGSAGRNGTASGTITVDPYFQIDPSTANASSYSIELSPGAGNAPPAPVPEPSVLSMLLIGLTGLGVLSMKRKVGVGAAPCEL